MSVNLLNKVSIDAGGGSNPLELTIGAAAENVSFNNMGTGLSATNVQTALKQVLAQNGYAVCETAGNVADKTVTITDFVLRVGSRLIIKFENQNLASSPTLNINNTGAKALKVNGEDINPAIIEEDSVFLINYNGNSYDVIIGGGVNAGANITMEEYTFLASGWSNSEYSLESDYPSSRYDIIEIGSSNTHTTQAMLEAWQAAEIYGWESTNKVVARGTVPSIDIIMVLVIVDKSTSGGGHVIKDSITEFTKRTGLKFVGATVTDDSVGDNTVVTIEALIPVKACYDTSPTLYAHAVGDLIYYNQQFYNVKQAIAVNDTLVIDTNIEAASLSTGTSVYIKNLPNTGS